MALTKVEAAKLTQDMLLRGVIETIVTESMILELLPFMEVTGTAVTYNREATLPTASFYDVGDTWTEATPTFTQVQATLKVLGGLRRTDTIWPSVLPSDVDGAVRNAAQLVASGIHSRRTAVAALGGADPEAELARVIEEARQLAAMGSGLRASSFEPGAAPFRR